jgi:hypothetical protein
VGFPLELRRFSLHHQSQNDFVAQSSFYPTGIQEKISLSMKLTVFIHIIPRITIRRIFLDTTFMVQRAMLIAEIALHQGEFCDIDVVHM